MRLAGPISDAHIDRTALAEHRFADGDGYPPSYVSFVQRVGWARALDLWLIYPPVLPGWADGVDGRGRVLTDRFREIYADARDEEFDWKVEPDGSWDVAASAVVFGWSENGDALLWDTRTRRADGEFDVYLSAHLDALRRIGSTLDEALEHLADGDALSAHPLSGFRLD